MNLINGSDFFCYLHFWRFFTTDTRWLNSEHQTAGTRVVNKNLHKFEIIQKDCGIRLLLMKVKWIFSMQICIDICFIDLQRLVGHATVLIDNFLRKRYRRSHKLQEIGSCLVNFLMNEIVIVHNALPSFFEQCASIVQSFSTVKLLLFSCTMHPICH